MLKALDWRAGTPHKPLNIEWVDAAQAVASLVGQVYLQKCKNFMKSTMTAAIPSLDAENTLSKVRQQNYTYMKWYIKSVGYNAWTHQQWLKVYFFTQHAR